MKYLFPIIAMGLLFVGCQAVGEWLIGTPDGAAVTRGDTIVAGVSDVVTLLFGTVAGTVAGFAGKKGMDRLKEKKGVAPA